MNLPHTICCGCLLWIIGNVLTTAGRAQLAAPVLEAENGRRIEFPTQSGHAYRIEATADGTSWQQVAGIVFGTGSPAVLFLKADALPPSAMAFRVVEVDPQTIGIAPVSLGAGTLSLVEQGVSHNYLFITATSGALQNAPGRAESFSYQYVKTGPDSGRLVSTGVDLSTTEVELSFLSESAGKFQRRRLNSAGQQIDDDAGTFAVSPAGVWTEGAAIWGGALNGVALTLLDGALPVRYAFAQDTVTRQIAGSPPQTIPYVFDMETPSRLTVNMDIAPGRHEEVEFELTSPSSGTVERRTLIDGVPAKLTSGSFSRPVPLAAPVGSGFNCPPNSVINVAWDMTDSFSGALTLDFDAASVGTKIGRDGGTIEFTPFTYNYTRIDDVHARLILVYPGLAGDEIEQVDLTFNEDETCSGTFVRKTYRNGALIASSTGTFGPGQAPLLR